MHLRSRRVAATAVLMMAAAAVVAIGQPSSDPAVGTSPPSITPVAGPAPTTPPASATANLPVDDVEAILVTGDYPGQPASGTLLWGAAISNSGDPATSHETEAAMGIRRTFHQWHEGATSMVDLAREDLRLGRLPWVSVKTPDWTEVAAGRHDTELDSMLAGLHELRGPIWLTVHHEPEGGEGNNAPDQPGGAAAHTAMNRHIRTRMDTLGVDNVALAPILMGYTFEERSGRNPDEWWVDDTYDFVGIDVYTRNEPDDEFEVMDRIREWAAARDMDVALGEWAVVNSQPNAAVVIDKWHQYALSSATDNAGSRIVAMSYFDSDWSNPPKGWRLEGPTRQRFQALISDPTSTLWTQRLANDEA